MMFRPSFIEAAAFAGIVLLILALGSPARGHSWYDTDCCDARDCRPLDASEVRPDGHGGWIWESKVAQRSFHFPASERGHSLRLSGEATQRFHGCEVYIAPEFGGASEGGWHGRCFYEPRLVF